MENLCTKSSGEPYLGSVPERGGGYNKKSHYRAGFVGKEVGALICT